MRKEKTAYMDYFQGLPIPSRSDVLLSQFTPDNLLAHSVGHFDPHKVIDLLKGIDRTYMTVDLGGDKAKACRVRLHNGLYKRVGKVSVLQSSNGEGYFDFLQEIGQTASDEGIRVGMSFAGPIRDGRATASPNMGVLFDLLQAKYDGDMTRIIPTLASVKNDAEAAIMAGALKAASLYPHLKHYILLIMGSGLGAAVLTKNEIIGTEAGHLEAPPELNPFSQQKACGMKGRTYTCLENIAAGVAGIEPAWERITSRKLKGPGISQEMLNGNETAKTLYNNTAAVGAHVIAGLMQAYDMSPQNTGVILHGGVYKVPGLAERQTKIANFYTGEDLQVVSSLLVSENACLEGAALGAFLSEPHRS